MLTPAHRTSLHSFLELNVFAKSCDMTINGMVTMVVERGVIPAEAGVERDEIKRAVKENIEKLDFSVGGALRTYIGSKSSEWIDAAFSREDGTLSEQAVEEVVREFTALDRGEVVKAVKAYEESRRRKRTRRTIESMFSSTSDAKRRRRAVEDGAPLASPTATFEEFVREREREALVVDEDISTTAVSKLKELACEVAILASERYPTGSTDSSPAMKIEEEADSRLLSMVNNLRDAHDGGLLISRNSTITELVSLCVGDGEYFNDCAFRIERRKRDEIVRKLNARIPGIVEIGGWFPVGEGPMLEHLHDGGAEGVFQDGREAFGSVEDVRRTSPSLGGFICFARVFIRSEELRVCLIPQGEAEEEEEDEEFDLETAAPMRLITARRQNKDEERKEEDVRVVGDGFALRFPRGSSSRVVVHYAVPA